MLSAYGMVAGLLPCKNVCFWKPGGITHFTHLIIPSPQASQAPALYHAHTGRRWYGRSPAPGRFPSPTTYADYRAFLLWQFSGGEAIWAVRRFFLWPARPQALHGCARG